MSAPFLPTVTEAHAHPVLWAMYAAGSCAVEGAEARFMGVADGSIVGRWRPAQHHWYLGDLLLGLHGGTERRLIVTMPPRHGKSSLISRYFAGWWVGRHPDHEIILASYGDRLTRGWSRQVRDDLAAHGEAVFGVGAISRASTAEWQPRVDREPTAGNFLATSVGGTATGKGAHLLIVDDLLKGVLECRSKALRDLAYEFLVDELLTRLAPGGCVIVIGTRWHPDDPMGRLLSDRRRGVQVAVNAVPWKYLSLPAFAEEHDDLGRKPGEPLWPERFPRQALEEIKADRDPRSWAALYQCRPVALGGEFFQQKWLRYWTLDGEWVVLQNGVRLSLESLRVFCTADLAVSLKDDSDWSVIATWGMNPGGQELVLLDLIRDRIPGERMIQRMRGACDRWGAAAIFIEKTIYHASLISQAVAEGLPARELQPDKDKKTRALPATALMEAGYIYFRAAAPWLPELEDELLSFPDSSTHDDQVDALSYAVLVARALRGRADGQGTDQREWREPDTDQGRTPGGERLQSTGRTW